jgi:hypothetical protein
MHTRTLRRYINPLSHLSSRNSWTCNLCLQVNQLPARYRQARRHRRRPPRSLPPNALAPQANLRPELLPELQRTLLDLPKDEIAGDGEALDEPFPIYVFLVDVSAPPQVVELVAQSVLAAMEGLSPRAWVGLATFSNKVVLARAIPRCTRG